jgi:hypothetical protein
MLKRRLARWGLAAALVLLAGAAGVWLTSPRDPITRDNCHRIRPGMTRQQVEELLGGPENGLLGPDAAHPLPCWGGQQGVILIRFRDDRVVDVTDVVFCDRAGPVTVLDHLRAWLGW